MALSVTALNEVAPKSEVGIVAEEVEIAAKEEVKAACELPPGLDPVYGADERLLVAVVDSGNAGRILARMRGNNYGRDAAVTGEAIKEYAGKVIMRTKLGSSRIVDMLTRELLPAICETTSRPHHCISDSAGGWLWC